MPELPIVCTLTPGERAARGDALLTGLARAASRREAIEGGHRFVFASDPMLIRRIAETIAAERQCCRFLTFRVEFEADNGPIVLTVTGPAGAREFLDELIS